MKPGGIDRDQPEYVTRLPDIWQCFLAAVLLRLAYLFAMRTPFLPFDRSAYWTLASSLLLNGSLADGDMPVTDFEPLYPIFLAATRLLSGNSALIVQVIQLVIASIGAIYLYRLADVLTGNRQIALIAASLYALDPLLIRQAAAPAESALFTTLLIAFTYSFVTAATAARMALAGLALGLVVLTRTMTLPLAGFAAAMLMARRRWSWALALALPILLLLLPFCIRNWSVNGSVWPTRSGLNLYIGNSPYTAALLPDYDLDILQEQAAVVERGLVHLSVGSPEFNHAADELLTSQALDYIREDPIRALRQKAINAAYFFSPRLVPFYVTGPDTRAVINQAGHLVVENPVRRPVVEHVAYSAFYAPVLVAALAGVYLRRRDFRRDAILWCVVANFVFIYALYFPATRYRAPMEFVLLLYAAVPLGRRDDARRGRD
jgi:Dolichyl-phosphate-mannose-protein mannosyltransferase